MKIVFGVLGILCVIASVILGLYVGVWICFIGGIVDIIEQVQAETVEAMAVAIGIAKIVFAGLAGWLSFFVGIVVSQFCFAIAES